MEETRRKTLDGFRRVVGSKYQDRESEVVEGLLLGLSGEERNNACCNLWQFLDVLTSWDKEDFEAANNWH